MSRKLLVAMVFGGLLLSGCSSAPQKKTPELVSVRYEVLSTTNHNLNKMKKWTPAADAKFTTTKGTEEVYTYLPLVNKQQEEGVTIRMNSGNPVRLVAQAHKFSGDLTCRIYLDDVLASESSTMASFGVVTCEATT